MALSAKLAGLEERYRTLSEMAASGDTAGTHVQAGNYPSCNSFTTLSDQYFHFTCSYFSTHLLGAENATNWVASLDFPSLPPIQPENSQPQPGALDDPYLEGRMTRKDRKLMYVHLFWSRDFFAYRHLVDLGSSFICGNAIAIPFASYRLTSSPSSTTQIQGRDLTHACSTR